MQAWLAILVLLASVLVTATSAADAPEEDRAALEHAARSTDPSVAADALFRLAEKDDADGAYATALTRYRAAVAALPSLRQAPRADARARYLAARSEGDFAPLARLERVRRDPKLASDAAAIDALALEADAFPPGLVRIEARFVCAEAYLRRLGRPAEGRAALRSILDDPRTDPLTRQQALRMEVDSFLEAGDLEAAAAASAAGGDPKLAARVAALVRRRAMHRASLADLAAVLAIALVSIALAIRRRDGRPIATALRKLAPLAIAFTAYVAIAGGALASGYEAGNARPFLAFGAALLPIALVARAWGAAGSPRLGPRIARGALCASSVIAASFLVLERIDVVYLEGFGL